LVREREAVETVGWANKEKEGLLGDMWRIIKGLAMPRGADGGSVDRGGGGRVTTAEVPEKKS